MRHRDHRYAHASEPADLGREHARGVDDDLARDVAALGLHARDAPVGHRDAGDPRVGEDLPAAAAGAVGERIGELAGVEVAVGRQPRCADHLVGDHQREALLRLVGTDQLERQPERLRPAGLAAGLLPALGCAGEPDAAALGPARVELAAAELAVQLDRVHHHPCQRHRRPQLADQARGVERRAAGELAAVHQDDVAVAELGQVVRDRCPRHPAADDHAARAVR